MAAETDRITVGGGAVEADGWRGNPAAERTPAHHPECRHCGAPLRTAAERDSGFCCAGCGYVYRLVHEHGLEGYYRIRDTVVAPAGQAVFQPRDYAWLEAMRLEAEQRDGTPELTLEIQGLSCAGCVWLIEKLFHQQPGALAIETDAQLGRMRLRWERGRFDALAFARLLQSFNYLAGPPGAEPAVPESRFLIRRIGLCAAFALNVMLFSLPVYFGMEESFAYARLFGTLAFAFATLSLLAGGVHFLRRAARALQAGEMHIDLPIAVGIAGSYLGSAWGWLNRQHGAMYFDFVATFILLMLIGRWAQVAAVERNRRRLLTAQTRPHRVRVFAADGSSTEQAVELLRAGDLYELRPGMIAPVESRLEDAAATLGTAWITGEAEPRTCGAGALAPAGALNLGRLELRMRATQSWSESLLAKLLQPSVRGAHRHRFLELVVRGYLWAIFGLALLSGLAWWNGTHDLVRTWSVVTAVLVVSCPCAIGLAFPLADEMATSAARRFGVFVREGDLWPRLAGIRKLIFDKTGTLTLETPVLTDPGVLRDLAPAARVALFALVRDNPHPVSQCLAENLLCHFPGIAAAAVGEADASVREEVGYGVALRDSAGHWTLGRPGWRGPGQSNVLRDFAPEEERTGMHDAEFARDGVVLARFRFADAVRGDAATEIAALKADGMETYILSGDREEKVRAMARDLGIAPEHAVGGVSPEDKSRWVRKLDRRDTLMLGDGANDSLAFDAAFARGTPVVHRGVLEGKADFYYLGGGIGGLRRLFAINRSRRRTQLVLLVFSVVYNLAAVGLAAAGLMNPLLAAILMPVSSLLTLVIVAAGMKRWLRF